MAASKAGPSVMRVFGPLGAGGAFPTVRGPLLTQGPELDPLKRGTFLLSRLPSPVLLANEPSVEMNR